MASFMAFLGAGGGLIMTSRRLADGPSWRNLATYALATGIAIVVLVFAFGELAEEPGTPLHAWIG